MAFTSNYCNNCHSNPANPGFKWCQLCYNNSKSLSKYCTNCNQFPANQGYSWCQQCYNKSKSTLFIKYCTNCNKIPANQGFGWCQQCYNKSKFSNNNNNNNNNNVILFYDRNSPNNSHYEFTNFILGYPFLLDNKMWLTSEHYFQAMKFIYYPSIMNQIQNASSAREAFDIAQLNSKNVRQDWQTIKDSVMLKALYAKFTTHSVLRASLKSTGNALLVEDSKIDSYWGRGNGTGQNKLGKLLMEVRNNI